MSKQTNCSQCGQPSSDGKEVCASCTTANVDATLAPQSSPSSSSVSTLSPNLEESFGEYELIEEIARGGMGVVYKARHVKLNRIAAIKMILGGRFSSADERQRFEVEAEAAARLEHPGIVPVYEFGELDDQAFFAMKYIDGGSLSERFSEFRTDLRSGVEMLSKVSRAVHHAHQRGILHRDLKPANILIDEHNQPLITDLGLAKSTTGESDLTNTGAILGTPSYMAPEQAAGQESITTAADVFSLGAILYELLTGNPPHKKSTSIETVMSVLNETPANPRKLDRNIDPELELICLKCIERDPNNRYSSAAELAKDLESWLAGEPISVRAVSLMRVAARWFNQRRRLVYAMFAMFLGLAFSLPFALSFFGGSSDLGDVYEHFPEGEMPWIYQLGKIPHSFGLVSMFVLFAVIWPAMGLINTWVTQPKSIGHAARSGAVTSILCAGISVALLGWLMLIFFTSNYANQRIQVLSQAIWVPADTTQEDALKAANELYPGLEEIPADQRAEILSQRIVSEQFANGPEVIVIIGILCCLLAIPVVYGAILAYILIQRRLPLWLLVPRYALAWYGTTLGIIFAILLVSGGANIEGRPMREFAGTFIAIVGTLWLIAYLNMRRWRKPKKPVTAA